MLTGPIGTYNYEDKVIVQAAGNHTFKGPKVRRDLVAVITEAIVTDFTRNDRKKMIGKYKSGDDAHIVKVQAEDVGPSLELQGELILIENEAPFAIVYVPDLASELWCTFSGLVYRRDE